MKRLLLSALLSLVPISFFAQNQEKKIAILEIVDRDENVPRGNETYAQRQFNGCCDGYLGICRFR